MSRFQCYYQSRTLLTPVTVTVLLPFPPFDLDPETSLAASYQISQKFNM